ncbi:MAG: bifunctional 4-hydroxy-2-oxoglutarate aldolase/2-dehydro-3-deoxy-phosphogluconate aldolase [Hyphomicrobiaceae bacterium]
MQSRLNPALAEALRRTPVVPVLTIGRRSDAVPLARALVDGGLTTLEITLRTPEATDILGDIAAALPHALVGAGTVLTPEQASRAMDAGARFLVSPGMTPRLAEAAETWRVPFLPGVATASEAMALADLGYRVMKLFPAEQVGGVGMLKALGAPLADLAFCPTGGIDATKAPAYLALANVVAVGGSWVAPGEMVRGGRFAEITSLARAAAALRG